MKLTYVNCDDWVGLYDGNDLVAEGHSLDWVHELQKLGINIVQKWNMNWMDDEGAGHMPLNLSEITYFDE